MKVVHILAGLGGASGVANIARRFTRVQRERDVKVRMLAPAFKWNPVYFGLLFAVRALWQVPTADQVWVHCSWTFPVWYGAFLAKVFRKRLVVVPEGSFDPKRLNNHARWKKRLVAPLDRWVLRQADEVLALCKDEIKWAEGFEPSAKVRFEKVPIFLSEAAGKVECAKAMGKPGEALHVLFLGRVEDPLKGVRYLERAVEELNGEAESFPLQEKGESSLLRSGKDSASPLLQLRLVSDHFGAELEKDWTWCDVLCLPTLSENFGLVVAEALERGKRVVVTDGAPAWEPAGGLFDCSDCSDCSIVRLKDCSKGRGYGGRLLYLRGYRDGTDEERVKLLKDALGRLSSVG